MLEQEFKGGVRNGQNFMEIERRWSEIETVLVRNPNLSIDGALQILRGRELKSEPTAAEKIRAEFARGAQRILKKALDDCPLKEIEYLGTGLRWCGELEDSFLEFVNKWRAEVRRQKNGLTKEDRREQYEEGIKSLRRRLAAQRQVLDRYEEKGDGTLVPRPLSELV